MLVSAGWCVCVVFAFGFGSRLRLSDQSFCQARTTSNSRGITEFARGVTEPPLALEHASMPGASTRSTRGGGGRGGRGTCMSECPFENAALDDVKLRHLWGLPQERLHFVDVGASYLNTSAAHFVRGYPRGHEFTVHLIEGNPRVEYTRRLARGVGIKHLGNVTRACAWTEDGVEFHSEGFATVPDIFPINSVVRTTPTHRFKHLVAQIPSPPIWMYRCWWDDNGLPAVVVHND